MGHNAGWLALGAGLAGGADVILLPEIPYNIEVVAKAIRDRSRRGSRFSIVAVSEGALSAKDDKALTKAKEALAKIKKKGAARTKAKKRIAELEARLADKTLHLSRELEKRTKLEARVTILGHLQRGGIPSAADRVLATRLGTEAANLAAQGTFGVMVAARGDGTEAVPLETIVGKRKTVPLDHGWIQTARDVGVCLGDEV